MNTDISSYRLGADAVKSVDIFVVRIDAKRQEPSDDDAAEATEEAESEKGGWVTVAEPNKSFDLMKLADGTTSATIWETNNITKRIRQRRWTNTDSGLGGSAVHCLTGRDPPPSRGHACAN